VAAVAAVVAVAVVAVDEAAAEEVAPRVGVEEVAAHRPVRASGHGKR